MHLNPFPDTLQHHGKGPKHIGPPFNTLAEFWRAQYGTKVQKIAIDAGMGCPHRKDRRENGGCIYCDEHGSGSINIRSEIHVQSQLHKGVESMLGRNRAEKFFSYLQSFTNTFLPAEQLRPIYEAAIDHPDVVGLSIGTRPDLLPPKTLDLLSEMNERTDLYLELGVESFHEDTLKWMNRAHPIEKTFQALENLKKRKIKTVVHLILGSPTDPIDSHLKSVEFINHYGVNGVKLHNLAIIRTSQLEALWKKSPFPLLTLKSYLNQVIELLERIPPSVVVHRTHCVVDRPENLIAPPWSGTERMARPKDLLIQEMRARGTWQGRLYPL